jgi:hypothetical protein
VIAGIGFVRMAWKLACQRNGCLELLPVVAPMRMSDGSPCCKACAEYYRILDLAERGHEAYAELRIAGLQSPCIRVLL